MFSRTMSWFWCFYQSLILELMLSSDRWNEQSLSIRMVIHLIPCMAPIPLHLSSSWLIRHGQWIKGILTCMYFSSKLIFKSIFEPLSWGCVWRFLTLGWNVSLTKNDSVPAAERRSIVFKYFRALSWKLGRKRKRKKRWRFKKNEVLFGKLALQPAGYLLTKTKTCLSFQCPYYPTLKSPFMISLKLYSLASPEVIRGLNVWFPVMKIMNSSHPIWGC